MSYTKLFYSFLFLGFLFLNSPDTYGQAHFDTTLYIPAVEISASEIRNYPTGSMNQEWTTAQLEKLQVNNIADLLSTEAGIFIKTYGLGSLATSSVRGGSAGHTLVLWNGFPIQSPMLGQLDLSLLPVEAVESINFTRGGNAALWGSGAIGGVLDMKNQADFSQKINIQSNTQIGSFGAFQQHLKWGMGNDKIQSVTRLSHQQAENDFYYFLADGLPERQQTNARLSQQLFSENLYWKIKDLHQMAAYFWWQQSFRQIPPTNVQNRSEAYQDDLSTRLVVEYKNIREKGLWQIKAGYFDEQLNYFDDLILLESPSHFQTYLTEVTGQWNWKESHQFLIGNTHTYTRVWSAGYRDNIPTEYKTAFFTSWKYKAGKVSTQATLRQEIVDGKVVPLTPAIGLDFSLSPSLVLKAKVSRNYRLPTFNDRYWIPGGKPDLLPESGWSQELTLTHHYKKEKLTVRTSVTAFNRNIDNWILWALLEDNVLWSANNITKVWSRGLEPRVTCTYQSPKIKYQLKGSYDYIRSTNQVAVQRPKMEVGDQLIYTPVHQGAVSFSVDWNALYFSYQHSFTGKSAGVNDVLEAYHLGDVRLQYTQNHNKYKGIIFLNINNIWDVDYLVIDRRPMPGIHFQAGIQINFTKKNKL